MCSTMLHMDFSDSPVRRRRQKRSAQVSWPYVRGTDGVWRYSWGYPVPGARDVTLGERYGFPVVVESSGPVVRVPIRMFRDPELSWVYGRYYDPWSKAPFVLVPLQVWQEHTSRVVGMDAPELDATRMLDTASVALRCGCGVRTISSYLARSMMPLPVVRIGGSPLWPEPVIARWQETRPGRGGRPRRDEPTGRQRTLSRMENIPALPDSSGLVGVVAGAPPAGGREAAALPGAGTGGVRAKRPIRQSLVAAGGSRLIPTSGLLKRSSEAEQERRVDARPAQPTPSLPGAGWRQVVGRNQDAGRQLESCGDDEHDSGTADLRWRATRWADVPDEELDEPQLGSILLALEAKAAERKAADLDRGGRVAPDVPDDSGPAGAPTKSFR
jgi:hypothetical protein